MAKWGLLGAFLLIILIIAMIIFYPEFQEEPSVNTVVRPSVENNTTTSQNETESLSPTPTTSTQVQSETNDQNIENLMLDEESTEPLYRISQFNESTLPTPTAIPLEVGKLVGRVIDENDSPIPSANIEMQSTEGIWIRKIKSDYAGRFVVTDPPDSNVDIHSSMNGYTDTGKGSTTADPIQAKEIVLTLQNQQLTISGLITNQVTKQQVPNFSLILFDDKDQLVNRVVSGLDGMYTFQNVTKGIYTIVSDSEKNESLRVDIPSHLNNREIVVAYRELTNVNFQVVPTILIEGVVQNMDNQPVLGAEIKSSFNSTKFTESNAQGKFEYQAPPGTVLIASHEQYGNGMSDPITVEQIAANEPVIITLQSPGSIFGKVFDTSKTPIQQADITLIERRRGITYEAQSNVEGIYSFDDIPLITKGETEEQFTHTIQFSKYGYETKSFDVILYPAEVNTRDVELQPASTITGQVFDSATNPLPGAHIKASGRKGTKAETISDPQGIFVLQTKSDETFDLQFEYTSSPMLSDIKLNVPAGTTGLQVVLDNNETIVTGKVSAENGQIIPQFSILAVGNKDGAPFQKHQDFLTQDGQFQLILNQPGTYQIHCTAPGYAPSSQSINAQDMGSPASTVNFLLQQEQSNGSILGQFVPPEGMTLSQVDVIGLKSIPTHGNDFFVHKLPAGSYSLIFYAQNNQSQFPIPLGVSQPIEVLHNQETNMGSVTVNNLMALF